MLIVLKEIIIYIGVLIFLVGYTCMKAVDALKIGIIVYLCYLCLSYLIIAIKSLSDKEKEEKEKQQKNTESKKNELNKVITYSEKGDNTINLEEFDTLNNDIEKESTISKSVIINIKEDSKNE